VNGKISIKNKKAFYQYAFIEKFIAGIKLTGTEIKSIRSGKVSLADSYCHFINNELWVKGIHIAEYLWGGHYNHDPKRERKLLLEKHELNKLQKKSKEAGLTIIAFRLFINEKGLAKLEIALAKGKKEYDRREDIKQKDIKREIDRLRKSDY
jgi:SsrA-binding protein